MIVNYTETGWQVITQRAHGLLAAQICAHWQEQQRPERWVETLIATAEHDDVYHEFDYDDLLNENGGPVNYKMTNFNKAQCDRQLQLAVTKSSWIRLLLSRHIQFIHGKEPEAKNYMKALQKQEKAWMSDLSVTEKELSAAYNLLEFCDAFSLLICQGLIQPEHRKMEISRGPDQTAYQLFAQAEGQLAVTPWPFEPGYFKVSYESRMLNRLTFNTVEEFRTAMFSTAPTVHELRICKH
jgi:hypothetical protein